MSDASNRIQKFSDDSIYLVEVLSGNNIDSENKLFLKIIPKSTTEINKLRVWLQKHQNESVTDGYKNKLFLIIDLYYRFYINKIITIKTSDSKLLSATSLYYEAVSNLISDYLQFPGGKLLSAKDKKKVMTWNENLIEKKLSQICIEKTNNSLWIVQDINRKDNSLSLLNKANSELWKENFVIKDKQLIETIKTLFDTCQISNNSLIIDINESTNVVFGTFLEEDNDCSL
jgi:hypothetical protein